MPFQKQDIWHPLTCFHQTFQKFNRRSWVSYEWTFTRETILWVISLFINLLPSEKLINYLYGKQPRGVLVYEYASPGLNPGCGSRRTAHQAVYPSFRLEESGEGKLWKPGCHSGCVSRDKRCPTQSTGSVGNKTAMSPAAIHDCILCPFTLTINLIID